MIRLARADSLINKARIDTRDSLWENILGVAGISANKMRTELSAVDEVLCTVDDYNYFGLWVNEYSKGFEYDGR